MNWISIVSLCISAIMMLISLTTLLRVINRDNSKDKEEETKTRDEIKTSLLKANMKLDQVCATTNETRTDVKNMEHRLSSVESRVLVLEQKGVNND